MKNKTAVKQKPNRQTPAQASAIVMAATNASGQAKKEAARANAGPKTFVVTPANLGETYIAVCCNRKAAGAEFVVRTTTDFDAVGAAGRKDPKGTWSIKGRYVDGGMKYDCDETGQSASRSAGKAMAKADLPAKPKKSPRWVMGYETVNALPIADFSGKAKDLPKTKKGVYVPDDTPAEEYDRVCWQVLLNQDKESTLKRMAVTVAAWGQAHGKAWWADVAEKYLPMAAKDMVKAGLKPRL